MKVPLPTVLRYIFLQSCIVSRHAWRACRPPATWASPPQPRTHQAEPQDHQGPGSRFRHWGEGRRRDRRRGDGRPSARTAERRVQTQEDRPKDRRERRLRVRSRNHAVARKTRHPVRRNGRCGRRPRLANGRGDQSVGDWGRQVPGGDQHRRRLPQRRRASWRGCGDAGPAGPRLSRGTMDGSLADRPRLGRAASLGPDLGRPRSGGSRRGRRSEAASHHVRAIGRRGAGRGRGDRHAAHLLDTDGVGGVRETKARRKDGEGEDPETGGRRKVPRRTTDVTHTHRPTAPRRLGRPLFARRAPEVEGPNPRIYNPLHSSGRGLWPPPRDFGTPAEQNVTGGKACGRRLFKALTGLAGAARCGQKAPGRSA